MELKACILLLISIFLPSTCSSIPPVHFSRPQCAWVPPRNRSPVTRSDRDTIQFALNLEYIEAEWFLNGALGHGLDHIAPGLSQGGPPPIGASKANLSETIFRIIAEFGYQEVGHIRAIKSMVGGFPRPLMDLSTQNFVRIFDEAFGHYLNPPFNPYANTINFLLASYMLPYIGIGGYVGANSNIDGYISKRLVAGLLAVEAQQDAIIRTLLYERANEIVHPYGNYTVAHFTTRLSNLRNHLGMCGVKDEGLFTQTFQGAEHRTGSNIVSANSDSLAYRRSPGEILRIAYETGNERRPGGFLPLGGNGRIARQLLHQ